MKLKEDFPTWNQTTLQDKESVIIFMISILNIKTSSKEEEMDLAMQMGLIADLISTQFPKLTIPEIKEAFKMYVTKKFESIKVFRLLDCIAIGEILSAYIDHRNESTSVYTQKRNIALLEASKEQSIDKEKIKMDFLQMVFKELKERRYSSDTFVFFEMLEKQGKITKSKQSKKEMYNREFERYVFSKKQEAFTKPNDIRKQLLRDLESKITNKTPIEEVKNICRSKLASDYLLNFCFDFKTFLNEVKEY